MFKQRRTNKGCYTNSREECGPLSSPTFEIVWVIFKATQSWWSKGFPAPYTLWISKLQLRERIASESLQKTWVQKKYWVAQNVQVSSKECYICICVPKLEASIANFFFQFHSEGFLNKAVEKFLDD